MTIEAAIDIETTGLMSSDHRIIEVYIGLYKDRKLVKEYEQRIDPQRSIAADAQRVHGITIQDLAGMPTWDTVAPIVEAYLNKADGFIWQNGDDFDGPFLKQELERVGRTMPVKPSFDTMVHGVWATPDGKKPSLEELCFACGVPYDKAKAHAAAYDVRETMMPAFYKAVDWGFFKPQWAV